ncbi:MAG: ferritin [Candidatus Micrarchaeota archaeon]|nr:ferritin [Candidatus Micrarchaeota archaeon]
MHEQMNKELLELVNQQINKELESAYIYFAASAICQNWQYRGFASWLEIQAKEELEHAKKFYQHLIDRNIAVEFYDIKKPKMNPKNLEEIFKIAYEHEQYISKSIRELGKKAEEKGDRAIIPLLDWFEEEQIEEEKITYEIYYKLKEAKNDQQILLFLDKYYGKRKEKEEEEK